MRRLFLGRISAKRPRSAARGPLYHPARVSLHDLLDHGFKNQRHVPTRHESLSGLPGKEPVNVLKSSTLLQARGRCHQISVMALVIAFNIPGHHIKIIAKIGRIRRPGLQVSLCQNSSSGTQGGCNGHPGRAQSPVHLMGKGRSAPTIARRVRSSIFILHHLNGQRRGSDRRH